MNPSNLLASWADTPTRASIEGFVNVVTDPADPPYAPPDERVAVFDNDGTLWCEKPMPVELGFILARFDPQAQADRPCSIGNPGRPRRNTTTTGWATPSPPTTRATTPTSAR